MSLLDTASLIVTPNGYKEGKLYSVIPSDGSGDMSVTRATTATRVNSAGLVELVPYNLLQYSQEFNNGGYWGLNNATITANNTTAPDGTLTADKVVVSANTDNVIQTGLPFVGVGNKNTISLYIKGSGSNIGKEVGLYIDRDGGGTYEASTVVGVLTAEWQRIEVTHTWVNSQSAVRYKISQAIVTTPASEFFIWGAQLVEGSVAKDYQKTETRLNIPRLDYSNGTCPSLLVEPQRTNLVFWSNNFSPSKAYNYQNASQSSSTITAPDGLTTTGITSTTSANDFHRFFKSVDASSATYTSSIYAKKGDSRYLGLGVNHNGSATKENIVVFDLQNGVIASNPYGVTATIEDANNGWYRLTHTFTYTGATAVDICVHNAGTGAFTTLNFQVFDSPTAPTTLYIYGLQFELGSYATSYIPTTSASVTRNADVISKTGISSLIGQTEGAVMIDINIDSSFAKTDMRFIDVSDNSIANWYFIGTNNANEIRFYFRSSNTAYVSVTTTLTNGRHKLAFAYKNNDYVAYVDGVQVHSTTTLAVGSTSKVTLGNDFGGFNPSKQFINAVALWKTRLTNTQLAALTTI